MGCSHCLDDSSPDGKHMDIETYKNALKFAASVEPVQIIMISGGEPTLHPQILEILQGTVGHKSVLSNGLFLADKPFAKKIIELADIIQVTNDPRYYPKPLPDFEPHKKVMVERQLRMISPFGRALKNNLECTQRYPGCFNLQSATLYLNDIKKSINELRIRERFCVPFVDVDGIIRAGETPFCAPIGNVNKLNLPELTENIYNLKCNQCGLKNNLNRQHKQAIGML